MRKDAILKFMEAEIAEAQEAAEMDHRLTPPLLQVIRGYNEGGCLADIRVKILQEIKRRIASELSTCYDTDDFDEFGNPVEKGGVA